MTWDDVLEQLRRAGLSPVEDVYMENYGKILAAQRPEFAGRYFRCAYGALNCGDVRIEALLFPSEGQLEEFREVLGDDPWWVPRQNVIFHFPNFDPLLLSNILDAISSPSR